MLTRRVTILCGHYGSGKTNIAINYAEYIKSKGLPVAIADLDIVNPYFRTKDSQQELKSAGIELVSLEFAGSNVDLPALPSAAYGLVQRKDRYVVLDIGGDDRGAYALGRYVPYILEENDYDMLLVTNFYRPLTRTVEDTVEVMKEIESASRMKFTGIVNNSNIGEATTAKEIVSTFSLADELSKVTGLPVKMTCAEEKLADSIECENLFSLKLQKKPF
ncbi:MAG: hypothetical protein IJU45_07630 [Clostridia bacterium]|nr:hypothetical protein [Clostridia bacterium]